MLNLPNTYKYDNLIGSYGKYVLVGECAMCRAGLTTLFSETLKLSTLYVGINNLDSNIALWYFNPFANKFFDTVPSPVCPNILEPSQERALIEYIMLLENFDEGILIEGLKTYSFQHDGDYSKLYDMLEKIPLKKELLDYWINEAETDEDD